MLLSNIYISPSKETVNTQQRQDSSSIWQATEPLQEHHSFETLFSSAIMSATPWNMKNLMVEVLIPLSRILLWKLHTMNFRREYAVSSLVILMLLVAWFASYNCYPYDAYKGGVQSALYFLNVKLENRMEPETHTKKILNGCVIGIMMKKITEEEI